MILRVFLQTTVWTFFNAAILFGAAGTVAYPGAWVLLLEMELAGIAIGLWLAGHDPALLKERMGSLVRREQRPADRIVTAAVGIFFYVWFGATAYAAMRLVLWPVPVSLQAVGAALVLFSFYAAYRTFRENSFAAPVVTIQTARGQHIIDTGPYRIVRHPMYAGALPLFAGVPLLLGSYAGLLALPVFFAFLMARTTIEERALREAFAGYADYAARVRYRILPLIW